LSAIQVPPLRTFDDPILKELCRSVRSAEEANKIGKKLAAAVVEYDGVGLAAPQIGYAVRACIIKPYRTLPGLVLINPEVIEHSEHNKVCDEGCLSYPGVIAEIERWFSVKVRYQSLELGKSYASPTVRLFTAFEARIVQHELDHIVGVCRVGDVWRKMVAQ
jgi:peptide deformylase